MSKKIEIKINLIKRLNKHIRKNNHTRCIKNKHALHKRPRQFIPRRIADDKPEGEEGDGEEVPEQDHGALDEAAQETDGAVDEAEFEVAEAAALEGAEVFVFSFVSFVVLCLEEKGEGKRGRGYHLQQKESKGLGRGY